MICGKVGCSSDLDRRRGGRRRCRRGVCMPVAKVSHRNVYIFCNEFQVVLSAYGRVDIFASIDLAVQIAHLPLHLPLLLGFFGNTIVRLLWTSSPSITQHAKPACARLRALAPRQSSRCLKRSKKPCKPCEKKPCKSRENPLQPLRTIWRTMSRRLLAWAEMIHAVLNSWISA